MSPRTDELNTNIWIKSSQESQTNASLMAIRLCSIIRVTSESKLHCPNLHKMACAKLEKILRPEAIGVLDKAFLDNAEDILGVVSNYKIESVSPNATSSSHIQTS
jgi:hypothetical protein